MPRPFPSVGAAVRAFRIVARAPSGRLVYDLIFLRRGRSVVILVFATTSQPGDLERRLAVRLAGRMR